jgi:6-phosphofructokinase 1
MGRSCGYLAVQAGIISGAEMVIIPEFETPFEEVAQAIEESYKRGKMHCIIVIAEGAKLNATEMAGKLVEMNLGFHTRVTVLGHVQRGGKPTAFDRLLATRFGVKAVEFLLSGQTGVMTGLDGREIVPVPLSVVCSRQRTISQESFKMARMLAR